MVLLMLMLLKCSFGSFLQSNYAFSSLVAQLVLKLQLMDLRFKSFLSILLKMLFFLSLSRRWIDKKGVQFDCILRYNYNQYEGNFNICIRILRLMKKSLEEYIFDLLFLQQLQMCRKILKTLIEISQYGCGEELLQSHMHPVNIKSLPQNFQSDVETLKLAAAQNEVLSLSSNQIKMQHRMFAILKPSLIIPGKWINYEAVKPNDYRVIINPILKGESIIRLKDFEQCPSIPGLRFHIWNPISQGYAFHTPVERKNTFRLEQKTERLIGFQSRVWDHEVRHMQGILALDPVISHMEISVAQDYQDNPAMHELVQNLKAELKLTSEKSMMKMMKPKGSKGTNEESASSPEQLPEKISKQMKGRMTKHYRQIKDLLDKHQKNKNNTP